MIGLLLVTHALNRPRKGFPVSSILRETIQIVNVCESIAVVVDSRHFVLPQIYQGMILNLSRKAPKCKYQLSFWLLSFLDQVCRCCSPPTTTTTRSSPRIKCAIKQTKVLARSPTRFSAIDCFELLQKLFSGAYICILTDRSLTLSSPEQKH